MTLPESNPASTASPASTGGAVPRSDSLGTASSALHCSLPSAASSERSRPSTVRTKTRLPATSGAASTSPLTLAFHSCLPLAASKPRRRLSLVPTTTSPPPTPGPAANSNLVLVRQRSRPLAGSSATISPSREAAVQHAVVEREVERQPQLFTAAANSVSPDFLHVERRLDVDQFGRAARRPCPCRTPPRPAAAPASRRQRASGEDAS